MSVLTSVPIGRLRFDRFAAILPPERYAQLLAVAERTSRLLEGRVVWNVNSTARGGGVAEMLISLLAYAHGAGVDTRWEVIAADERFFTLTKRIHNNFHSADGDAGELGDAEHRTYEEALAPNVEDFVAMVRPHDVVIVHDPQPAGLIPLLKARVDVAVIWRCHVGIDVPSELSRRAWRFLRRYVEPADAYVFSRRAFAWEDLDTEQDRGDRAGDRRLLPEEPGPRRRDRRRDPARRRTERRRRARRRPDLPRHRRHPEPREPPRRDLAGAPPPARRPGGAPGLALGSAQGPARRDPGLRRARRAGDRRAFGLRRAGGRRGRRRSRGRERPRGRPAAPSRSAGGGARARPPRVRADGRRRRERGDRQRAPAPRRRDRAEEPRGGLRPHGRGRDVEGAAGRRVAHRGHSGSDRRRPRAACCSTTPPTSRSTASRSRRSSATPTGHTPWAERRRNAYATTFSRCAVSCSTWR